MTRPDDLDRRLEDLGAPEEASMQHAQEELLALEKLIHRRVRSICLKTLLAVAICAALLFGLIHPLIKFSTFNPIPMEEDGRRDFTAYLNAYFGTMTPYVRITGTSIKDTGFGTYDVTLYTLGPQNLRAYMNADSGVHMAIRLGKAEVTSDPTRKLIHIINRFDRDFLDRSRLLTELEMLPSSAYIRLSVGLDAPLTLEELRALPAEVAWAQVYDPDVEYNGGVNLAPAVLFNKEPVPRELNEPLEELRALPAEVAWAQVYDPDVEYNGGVNLAPAVLFNKEPVPRELNEQELIQYYADNLELLLTQPELLTSLGIHSADKGTYLKASVMEETLASARKLEDFRSQNFCVQGSRDEILALIDQTAPNSLGVEHIFLTPLSD